MTQRRAVMLYVLAVHLVVGIGGALLLWPDRRPWILALEGALVLSTVLAWRLVRNLQTPAELVRIGSEWMREGDFSHTFYPRGAGDLRRLIALFNSMLQRLREERTSNQEQETLLRKLVEASPSGTVITDHDGCIMLVNPAAARLLEVKNHALLGSRPRDVAHPLIRQLVQSPEGEPHLLEATGRRKLRGLRSRFLDRGFPREFFLVEDITHELWETEKQAYRTLIRTLSHEVNNTLAATSSILHSVKVYGDQLGEEDRKDFVAAVGVAIERADHLKTFMGRYAEVARVPTSMARPTDVGEMLRRIVLLHDARCQQRAITLSLDLPDGDWVVAMDEAQMEQVLVNVLANAIEAVDRDGTIVVRLKVQDGEATVVFEDSGPGLGPEAEANLFVPFFSTKPEGQGIGLTLAREILTLHRFHFSLSSQRGGPTLFRITMPLGRHHEQRH